MNDTHGGESQSRDHVARARPRAGYRYYDLVVGAFVAVLLCSNLIGPGKTVALHIPSLGLRIPFGIGNLFFPVAYIFGDLLTEVYGYARARRAIWSGFGGMAFAAMMSFVVIHWPPDATESNRILQPALEIVFGNTWRITIASVLAYWCGDFVNSYVLAKMKIWTAGRMLWTRTIGSTIAGQLVDSIIFYPLAWLGIWDTSTVLAIVLTNWVFKVSVEVVCTPATYLIVNTFKRLEQEDYYDFGTDFTPFSLKD